MARRLKRRLEKVEELCYLFSQIKGADQLMCPFVFEYEKSRFAHDAVQLLKNNVVAVLINSFVLFIVTFMLTSLTTYSTNFTSDLISEMSHSMRKPTFCICENKDADQLRGNREADQRLCFRYIDSTIPILSKSEISSL